MLEKELLAKCLREFMTCGEGNFADITGGRCDDLIPVNENEAVYRYCCYVPDEATIELENSSHAATHNLTEFKRRCLALKQFMHNEVLLKVVRINRDAWLSSPEMVMKDYTLWYSGNYFAQYNKSTADPPLEQQRESAWDCIAYHEYPSSGIGTRRRNIHLLIFEKHVVVMDFHEQVCVCVCV